MSDAPPQAALTVESALAAVLDGVVPLADVDSVPLLEVCGRILARPIAAALTQPPFVQRVAAQLVISQSAGGPDAELGATLRRGFTGD